MRPIEDAGSGRLRDVQTKDLLSVQDVAAEYNAMLSIVQKVAVPGCAERDVVDEAQNFLRSGASAGEPGGAPEDPPI